MTNIFPLFFQKFFVLLQNNNLFVCFLIILSSIYGKIEQKRERSAFLNALSEEVNIRFAGLRYVFGQIERFRINNKI